MHIRTRSRDDIRSAHARLPAKIDAPTNQACRGLIASVTLLFAMTPPSAAQPAPPLIHPKGYVCHRAESPPRIDGKINEAIWSAAAWTDDFVDIEGEIRPAPRFRTRAKMLWDDECFYVAAELTEPHVWGTLTQRDSVIFNDNDFEVFIDPDGDNHQYYEFEINALGTFWDLLLIKPYIAKGPAVNGWDIRGIRSAVHVEGSLNDARDVDRGWSVEIAFPWAALRECAGDRPAPPKDGDQWRVNFSRVQWQHELRDGQYAKIVGRKEDNWVWSPQGMIDMHRPWKWGYVQFSSGAPGTAKFSPDLLLPARHWLHLIAAAQHQRRVDGKPFVDSLADMGLDVPADETFAEPPKIRTTFSGFEAIINTREPRRCVHICDDWRCWVD